jgi:hypothetical protein
MTQTHVTDPIKDLTLSIGGERIQVTMGTIRPQDGSEPLVLTVAPADAGRRVFGRRGTLRLLGYAAAATDIGEIDPGVMTWTQVCSCNAARLKRDLMALEPVLSADELTAMALA